MLIRLLSRRSIRNLYSRNLAVGSDSSPISDIRKAHRFDEQKLITYLRNEQVLNQIGDVEIKQFAHGQSNPTYLVIPSTGKRIVMRKQPPGALLKGAHAVDREYRVMSSLQATNVPVPRSIIYCSDVSIINTPFFCYEYVDGRFFKSPSMPTLKSSLERFSLYTSMIDAMARIHSVDIDKHNLGDFGARIVERSTSSSPPNHLPYVLRQIKTWTKQYRATETDKFEDMEYLIGKLPQLLPVGAEHTSTLVHGDFRMDNVIFKSDYAEVAAVLDWELSTLGDPMSDLANSCISYYIAPNNPFFSGLKGLDLISLGIPSLEQTVSCYAEKLKIHSAGRLRTPTAAEIDYYLSFSFFRTAAILQGVYKRSLMGNASAENAGSALQFAKECASISRSLLNQYEEKVHPSHIMPETAQTDAAANKSSIKPGSPSEDRIPGAYLSFMGARARELITVLKHFLDSRVLPLEKELTTYQHEDPSRWTAEHASLAGLRKEAKALGLWNLFMPVETDGGKFGAGLSNLEVYQLRLSCVCLAKCNYILFYCSVRRDG